MRSELISPLVRVFFGYNWIQIGYIQRDKPPNLRYQQWRRKLANEILKDIIRALKGE